MDNTINDMCLIFNDVLEQLIYVIASPSLIIIQPSTKYLLLSVIILSTSSSHVLYVYTGCFALESNFYFHMCCIAISRNLF